MGGYQAITFIGGLRIRSPIIIRGFLIGRISLIGVPFMASFYSKEPLIEILNIRNFLLVGYFLILRGVYLTCLYSLRLVLLSGIFLVRHCSIIHILERMKSVFRIFLLFFPSFIRGTIFSNFFSYLRFESLINSKVKINICFSKNYIYPWLNSYMGLMTFTSRFSNFIFIKNRKMLYFIRTSMINYNLKNVGPSKFFFKEKIFFFRKN